MTVTRTYPDAQRYLMIALMALWLFFAVASCDDSNDYDDHAATADYAERLLK
jgi:hypothetical protein